LKRSKGRNKSLSKSATSSIIPRKEISETLIENIVRKLKNKMIILYANKHDYTFRYFEQEFWGFLKDYESLIYDNQFNTMLESAKIVEDNKIKEFKKIYCENLIKETQQKQRVKIFSAHSFSYEILMNYEVSLINSYNCSADDFIYAVKLYSKTNE
jgi:lauroyl/myristoyl acyltransferase